MTDELRAAAEKILADEQVHARVGFANQIHREALALAKNYLAEHPADDGEPVTGEWLRAVGFYNVHPEGPNHYLRNKQGLFVIHDANGWRTLEFLVDNPTYLPTRVHVRRLCAALGVPLQEPP